MELRKDSPVSPPGESRPRSGNLPPGSSADSLVKLAVSLALCMAMGMISGCATVQTGTAQEEEETTEEELVKIAEEKPAEPEKKVETKKKVERTAEVRPAPAAKRAKPRPRKPKPAPRPEVARESSTVILASTSQPPKSNGFNWLYVAAPIAIASAGLHQFLRRRKRLPGKSPLNLRSAGPPPDRPPPQSSAGPP